jgi:hypothetical protein
MNTMTETQTTRPHALAIDLLKAELTKAGQQVIYYGNQARRAHARPKRDGAEIERAEKLVNQWRDRHGRLQESLLVLEDAQRQLQPERQLPPVMGGGELNYFAAADAIAGYFIERPENIEILNAKPLGHGHWDVDTKVTYAGTKTPEPRPFLLVRTSTGKLLVNP